MNNLKNNFSNKPLPRFLGIFILLFSIITISWLSRNSILFGSKAATGNVPKEIQISNITGNAFTVSYVTDESVTGTLTYGKDAKLGQVAFDIRDNSTPLPHNAHYVTVSNLTPITKYFFTITSGDTTSPKDTPYEITTGKSLASNSKTQFTISGKATLIDGSAPIEAIAYVQSDKPASMSGGSQLFSTLLNSGSYTINLNVVRTKDLASELTLSKDTTLNLIIANSTTRSNISFLAGLANPIPPIILSKNYDFKINNQPLPVASGSAQVTGFPASEINNVSQVPQILTPTSSQEFKDQKPLFEGRAIAGEDVEITIQSEQVINTIVQANNNGVWQYRPTTPLTPGKHTITIKTLDINGVLKTITRSFTVFAEGSQFIEPSVSPTIAPTAAPSPTPTLQPTSTPSAIPTPIIINTSPVISAPTGTPVTNITTPPIPQSGSFSLGIAIFGIISTIGIGGLLFLLL